MQFTIKKGDAYYLPIEVQKDDEPLQDEEVELIEVLIGDRRATFPGECLFSESVVRVPLTQEETFAMADGKKVMIDLRVKFTNGDVIGVPTMLSALIADTISEVEL